MENSQQDPLVGTRIREYEILEVIGKGGMGAVYKARHVYLEEERAIKVIQTALAGDKEFIDRFIREAKILTKLRHPNLIQLYEFGTMGDNGFFMVLELLPGESVSARIDHKEKISVQQALKIVREAALGLHSAHQKGIVHRDISPDNLFLARDDSGTEITKVIDFGIARPNTGATTRVTMANVFVGKPEFCSPEQCGALEEGETIDRRSDIYSLGVTLYYLLAGKLPFYSSTPQGYLFKHIAETPKPLSTVVSSPEFPKDLDRIVSKALAKKREDRYATMEEFAQDLDGVSWADVRTVKSPLDDAGTLSEFKRGDVFAQRYLVEKKLGEGGMGVVYKATDTMLNVSVALKVMSAQIAHNHETLERLKREVILARRVSHPNACRIYDIGESGGVHYVSMEYLEGRTLAELVHEQRRLNPELGVSLIKQVLQALQAAHHAGVIHRDLKPQNIMVDSKNRASIMDFGISFSSEAGRLTKSGMVVGTPHYMAPEQLGGKEIDGRSDIYSIGIIMFQIFTGRLPFDAKSPIEIITAHLKAHFPRPSQIVTGFPDGLEKIILRALKKEPEARYQSVEELLQALESWHTADTEQRQVMDQAPTMAQATSVAVETRETMPVGAAAIVPRRVPILWIAAAVVILIAGSSIWFYNSRRSAVPAVPPATVSVVINALPWARVKVTPVSNDVQVQIPPEENVTPCSWLLPQGEYDVELTNNSSSQPVVKRIQVKSGEANFFQFEMPAFDTGAIQARIEGL